MEIQIVNSFDVPLNNVQLSVGCSEGIKLSRHSFVLDTICTSHTFLQRGSHVNVMLLRTDPGKPETVTLFVEVEPLSYLPCSLVLDIAVILVDPNEGESQLLMLVQVWMCLTFVHRNAHDHDKADSV
jgi:hypothetical protein